jgi:hypothetical protein
VTVVISNMHPEDHVGRSEHFYIMMEPAPLSGSQIDQQGTCLMGNDPEKSVTKGSEQSWHCPGGSR